MKKKVFRERYNMVNGNGEIIEEGLTIEDIKKIEIAEDKTAGEVKIPAMEYKDEEIKPKKRGRKKSVKSDK